MSDKGEARKIGRVAFHVLDAVHDGTVPLSGYSPTTAQADEVLIRRDRRGGVISDPARRGRIG